MQKRTSCFLVVGAALVLLSVGLMGTQELATDQTLRVVITGGDVTTIDPHKSTAGNRALCDMLFDGLLRYKPGTTTEFEPDLAAAMPEAQIVDGKQVWTFHLREGVNVHPFPGYPVGYELTAEDVVYSLERAANPEFSAFSGSYAGMTFDVVDTYVVSITLEEPLGPYLFFPKVANYAGGFIVPARAAEQLGVDEFNLHPVGTGPFIFSDYTPGDKLVLTRNPDYFRGTPIIEKVESYFMAESSTRELSLQAGDLDMCFIDYTQDTVDRMEAHGIPVRLIGPGATIVLYLNTALAPLDSLEVRQAIAYALDRQDNAAYYGMLSAPLYSQASTMMPGGLSVDDIMNAGLDYVIERDLVEARRLLSEAGYPDGFTLEATTTEHTNYLPAMEIARVQLEEIGIELKLDVVDHSTFHQRIRQDLYPIVPYSCARESADAYLTQFWHSDSRAVVGESPVTNFSQYANPTVDGLIELARQETAADTQIDLWKLAQIEILRDAAMYPLIYLQVVVAVQEYVELGYDLEGSMNIFPPITIDTKLLKH